MTRTTRQRLASTLAAAAVLGGCQASGGLVRVTEEPEGTNCEHGGQKLETGVDIDRNGLLDDIEVTTTAYVCHGMVGADGASALVNATAEAPGESCAAGGTRLDVGIDDDGDGVLDAAEIDTTEYVCSPTGGIAVLMKVTREPEGEHCTAGGQRIDSGLDDGAGGETAGDGVLGAGEIDTTRYVCNGTSAVATLLTVTPELPGTACPAGGQRIDAGLDDGGGGELAGDGALGAGEIDVTRYVCNGVDGSDGVGALVVMSYEPPGANCYDGGRRIDVGLDDGSGGGVAGNGTLEPGEITGTAYVCAVPVIA